MKQFFLFIIMRRLKNRISMNWNGFPLRDFSLAPNQCSQLKANLEYPQPPTRCNLFVQKSMNTKSNTPRFMSKEDWKGQESEEFWRGWQDKNIPILKKELLDDYASYLELERHKKPLFGFESSIQIFCLCLWCRYCSDSALGFYYSSVLRT